MKLVATTIWTIVLSLLTLVVGTIFRVEIEEFWNDHIQPFLMEKAWPQVAAMFDYIYSPLGAVVLFFIIFTLVSLVSRWMRRKPRQPSMVMPPDTSPSVDPKWREAYFSRPTLKIYEAACLLGGVLPQKPVPLGAASSYVEEFQHAVRDKRIKAIDQRPLTISTMTAMDTQRKIESHEHIVNALSDETVVSTASVIEYMEQKRANPFTPLIEVAALALSRIRDTDTHIIINYAAHGTTNELRRMTDLITRWYDVNGRIPHTQAVHKIRAGSYYTNITDSGDLVAVEAPNSDRIAFVDLTIPTADVEKIISSTICRLRDAFGLDEA